LCPPSDENLAANAAFHVFKIKTDPILDEVIKPHSDGDLIQGGKFAEIFAGAIRCHQTQAVLELPNHVRSILSQEYFSASALPFQVVNEIYRTKKAGFFECYNVAIFITVSRMHSMTSHGV